MFGRDLVISMYQSLTIIHFIFYVHTLTQRTRRRLKSINLCEKIRTNSELITSSEQHLLGILTKSPSHLQII